jgi:hypothetical protein
VRAPGVCVCVCVCVCVGVCVCVCVSVSVSVSVGSRTFALSRCSFAALTRLPRYSLVILGAAIRIVEPSRAGSSPRSLFRMAVSTCKKIGKKKKEKKKEKNN